MRWAGHVPCMGRNEKYINMVRDVLRFIILDGRIILK
jgi:hypothetical protein